MLLIESEMPVNKVARILSVNPNRIWNVFNYWISKAHTADQIEELEKIGFDETSVKKGHNYVTTMVDWRKTKDWIKKMDALEHPFHLSFIVITRLRPQHHQRFQEFHW